MVTNAPGRNPGVAGCTIARVVPSSVRTTYSTPPAGTGRSAKTTARSEIFAAVEAGEGPEDAPDDAHDASAKRPIPQPRMAHRMIIPPNRTRVHYCTFFLLQKTAAQDNGLRAFAD
jgi:hypothetical protein